MPNINYNKCLNDINTRQCILMIYFKYRISKYRTVNHAFSRNAFKSSASEHTLFLES